MAATGRSNRHRSDRGERRGWRLLDYALGALGVICIAMGFFTVGVLLVLAFVVSCLVRRVQGALSSSARSTNSEPLFEDVGWLVPSGWTAVPESVMQAAQPFNYLHAGRDRTRPPPGR